MIISRRISALSCALLISLSSACGSSDSGGGRAATDSTEADAGPDEGDGSSTSTTSAIQSTEAVPARPSTGCATGDGPSSTEAGTGDAEAETEGDTAGGLELGETTDEVLHVGDLDRTWRQFVPDSYDGLTPLPVVIQIHGLSQPHTTLDGITGYEKLAATEGFILLTPSGRTDPLPFWAATTSPDNPDLAFLNSMLDAVEEGLCVDEARIYSTGISNGGLMSFVLACTMSDRIAAIAPVSGVVVPGDCNPGRAVPTIAFYGDADTVLPFEGGLGGVLTNGGLLDRSKSTGEEGTTAPDNEEEPESPDSPGESVPGQSARGESIPDRVAKWAAILGCPDEPTVERVSEEVRRESWSGCDENSEIDFYVVEGGGHSWPGSEMMISLEAKGGNARIALMGHTTAEISATELAWQFFRSHAID